MKDQQPLDAPDEPLEENAKHSLPRLFISAQIAAFIGTAVDFITVILLTEFFNLWYVVSNAIGATFGAITNFLLGTFLGFFCHSKKNGPTSFSLFFSFYGKYDIKYFGRLSFDRIYRFTLYPLQSYRGCIDCLYV